MFNKNSNKTLWLLFAVLLVAVILIFTTESTKKERSFKKDIVEIDTTNITALTIFPKTLNGEKLDFFKADDLWKVKKENSKEYSVPKAKIDNLFSQLIKIKPKRVVSRSKDKWKNYEIDSSSTRVVVYEGSSKVLDLIIGKFAFQQPRSMSTFVKLADGNDVYEVDGFLGMSFNRDINSFRNETVLKSDNKKWNKLKFESNLVDGTFELVKVDDSWLLNGVKTDSAKTEKALSSLSRLTNTKFIDVEKSNFPPQTSKLIIEQEAGEPIVITAYQDSTKYIIESSLNPENYFDGTKVGDKIFFKKESLF